MTVFQGFQRAFDFHDTGLDREISGHQQDAGERKRELQEHPRPVKGYNASDRPKSSGIKDQTFHVGLVTGRYLLPIV